MAPDPQLPTDPPSEDALSKSLAPGTTDYNKRQAFTCGGCDNTWTGMVMAHCAISLTVRLPLAEWDGHTFLNSEPDTTLSQLPVDAGRGAVEPFADLWSAQAFAVQPHRFVHPGRVPMDSPVHLIRDGLKIDLAIVGSVPVEVVNLVLKHHPASSNPVLVGLDVLPWSDEPAQNHVPVRSKVPMRLVLRDRLAAGKGTHVSRRVSTPATDVASPPLLGTLKRVAAINTGSHTHTLHVTTHCHQTFGSVNSFDRHRRGGHCTPPQGIGLYWNPTRKCWSEAYGGASE